MRGLFRFLRTLALSGGLGSLCPAAMPVAEATRLTTPKTGPWRSPPGTDQLRIWPGPAPDGTFRLQPPENVETYEDPGGAGR